LTKHKRKPHPSPKRNPKLNFPCPYPPSTFPFLSQNFFPFHFQDLFLNNKLLRKITLSVHLQDPWVSEINNLAFSQHHHPITPGDDASFLASDQHSAFPKLGEDQVKHQALGACIDPGCNLIKNHYLFFGNLTSTEVYFGFFFSGQIAVKWVDAHAEPILFEFTFIEL
jgi:hypothetical protein